MRPPMYPLIRVAKEYVLNAKADATIAPFGHPCIASPLLAAGY